MTTKKISNEYYIDNATCYDMFDRKNGELERFALRIVPNSDYSLRRTELALNQDTAEVETVITYAFGYVQICESMLSELFSQYDTILTADIPTESEVETDD